MLRFRAGNVTIRLYFGFFAMLAFYYYFYGSDALSVCAALVCCLLHEAGHLTAMLLTGHTPQAICFYAGGIKLVPQRGAVPRSRQALILAAGCAVNMTLAGVSLITGQQRLMYTNLAVGLINLLPLSCLDGGRLLSLFISEKARRVVAAFTLLPVLAAVSYASPAAAVMLAVFSAAAELVM